MKSVTRRKQDRSAFTLIELLVVIAVIALLLSVVMPALMRAKEMGKRSVCLFNAKGLTSGWLLYIQENDGRLPNSYTSDTGWIRAIPGYTTNPTQAPVSLQMEALEKGLLYPYVETAAIYRCPIAKKNELRTYGMSYAMNGSSMANSYGGTVLTKLNEIKNTGSRIVFLDGYASDWDGAWMIFDNREQWWNTTPIRHGSGGNVFSFADNHSEFWSWKDQRTIALAQKCFDLDTPDAFDFPESIQTNNEDLTRVQKGVWGKLGYSKP